MSFAELRELHRLHLLDLAIVEIKKRAAALDPGKAVAARIAQLQAEIDSDKSGAKAQQAELSDLELQQKAIDQKLAQIEKELYGGKVVNPREVEAFQKEIELLKRRRSEMDDRILELLESLPSAKESLGVIESQIAEAKKQLAEQQKAALKSKAELEQQYREVSLKRPEAAKKVSPSMLARYEAVRKRTGGISMADVVRGNFCGMCGTHLPEKLVEGAKDGRIVTCESCHRILYASDGIV